MSSNGVTCRLILTGASGGLGQAFALALAEHSSVMVLVGRDQSRLDALREKIGVSHPAVTVRTVSGDLTEAWVQRRVYDVASDVPGPVNLLINAAGINDFEAFESQSATTIERLIAVNLLAPIQLTQLLLPLLKEAARAQVINVGSIFGYLGYPGFAVYCATKFGLRGFSQALRRELSDTDIAVRYFAPRATRTPLTTPSISAMNHELNTKEDAPEHVARMLVKFISRGTWERKVGFPERLYVFLNHLVPGVNDRAIRGQLKVIRKHLPGGAHSRLKQKGVDV
jgi:short-subunit dehydrogenase